MSAAVVTQKFSIDSADETFILVGTGAPTGGLVPASGLPGVYAAAPGYGSLFIQRDGTSGNQLWLYGSSGWAAISGGGGGSSVTSVFTRTGDVVAASNDYTFAQLASKPTTIAGYGITDIATTYAPLASPALTGTPTVPTATVGTNTTQAASTAFVLANTSSAGVSTFNSRSGAVVPTSGDYTAAQVTGAAPLASPTLTGTPAAPTASVSTNTTQIATTAFVVGQVGTATPLINGTAAVGTSLLYARQDHVHPTDTTRAALASPTFTGTPAAPTAAVQTNTTQVATTAYVLANTTVQAQIPATLSGNVTLTTADGGLKNYTTGASNRMITLPAHGSTPTTNAPVFMVGIKNNTASANNILVNDSSATLQATLTPGMYINFVDLGASWDQW